MGYNTDFLGKFNLNKPLSAEHLAFFEEFAHDDHHDEKGSPGYYCQWVPTDDGTAFEWDGNEKFYHYIEWIKYLIDNFLTKWGYVLNGEVEWNGDDPKDVGKIVIKDNVVTVKKGRIVYDN